MKEDHETANDLIELLHPAKAFCHPTDVMGDPDLTLNEKRAILASWASDACALEASPGLREPPDGPLVRFDDIMDALRVLDREAGQSVPAYRKVMRKRRFDALLRSRADGSHELQ